MNESDKKIPSELLCAVLMNGEVGYAIIAVKFLFQPLLSLIRANWEFSSNCDYMINIAKAKTGKTRYS